MNKIIYIFIFFLSNTSFCYADTGKTIGVDISSMKDIYDIKTVKTSLFLDFLFYPIYVIVFFMFFYYFLNKYFNIDKEKMEIEEKVQNQFKIEISNEFIELKNILEKLEKIDFYTSFNNITRKYFSWIGIDKIYNKTLKEIKKDKSKKSENIINLFEKTYFWEFNFENDDFEIRKGLIDQVLSYINKK